jgi:hypothetical protein
MATTPGFIAKADGIAGETNSKRPKQKSLLSRIFNLLAVHAGRDDNRLTEYPRRQLSGTNGGYFVRSILGLRFDRHVFQSDFVGATRIRKFSVCTYGLNGSKVLKIISAPGHLFRIRTVWQSSVFANWVSHLIPSHQCVIDYRWKGFSCDVIAAGW